MICGLYYNFEDRTKKTYAVSHYKPLGSVGAL